MEMEVEELLNFFEEKGISEFVEVVKEPEFSKQKLLDFQDEFGLSSIDFYSLYTSGLLGNWLCEEKMSEWAYNYRVFVRANGNLEDLLHDPDINEKKTEKNTRLFFIFTRML